jgi:predicted ATP-dependent serine protease
LRLSDVPPDDRARILVRKDWDSALGGPGERGVLEGTIVFVVGKGGTGKTTDMLKIAELVGEAQRRPCAYASSEREVPALSAQARKVGITGRHILPVRVHAMPDVISFVEEHQPGGLVLDSWSNLEGAAPNDLDRLREALGMAPAFVIIHVTKADEMAGSSKLAHKADAIVWMLARRLRVTKNWHGPNGVTVPRQLPKFKRPKKK